MRLDPRALAACVLLSAAAVAASGDLAGSPYTDVLVASCLVAALLALGWFAGWPAVWMFSLSLVLVSVLYTELFWTDDPARSGIDDLSPVAIVLALPVAWVAIAAGVAGRRLTRRFQP